MKPIPFVLDRMCGTSFSKQLLEGLRDAIHIGYYPAGSVLPPRREISRWLGVSEIVVRSAFAQLAAEGLVVSRPRIGTVVLPQKSPVWRGHVLCVMTDHDFNFRLNSEVEILRSKLTREGFLFSQVQVLYGRSGKPDFTAFDHSIGRSVDFAVLAFGNDVIERRLSESGIPYAVLGGAWNGMKGCAGCLHYYYRDALADFAEHCKEEKIRNVTIVCCNRKSHLAEMAVDAVGKAGIGSHVSCVSVDNHFRRLESVASGGAAFARRLFAGEKNPVPHVLFVTDDYLASGIIAEAAASGIDIPRDLKIACCVTEGSRPYTTKSLAGISLDPEVSGNLFADKLIDLLKSHRPFPNLVVKAKYIRGESFA